MTGTRRPRRHRETETRCHRETETETETVTSSAAAAPALPTANGGILRLDACLRRTSGRAGAVLAAGTDLMIDMDMIIMVVMNGEWVEEVVMQMRSPMAGLGHVLQGGIKMGFPV